MKRLADCLLWDDSNNSAVATKEDVCAVFINSLELPVNNDAPLPVFSVLLVLKIEGYLLPASVSWFLVFAPLFICDGLNAYFCIIVFIRDGLHSSFMNHAWHCHVMARSG